MLEKKLSSKHCRWQVHHSRLLASFQPILHPDSAPQPILVTVHRRSVARGLGRGAETPADPPPGSCTGHPAHSSHPVKVAPRPGLDRCFCPHRRLRAHRRKSGRRCPGHQAGPSLASLTAPPPGSPPAASLPRSPPSPAGGPLAAAARKRTPASPLPGQPPLLCLAGRCLHRLCTQRG